MEIMIINMVPDKNGTFVFSKITTITRLSWLSWLIRWF